MKTNKLGRRDFIWKTASAALAITTVPKDVIGAVWTKERNYQRANTEWLAKCSYGISFHWTPASTPLQGGPPIPYRKAVEKFDINSFIEGVKESEADYVIFTGPWNWQFWPGPHPIIDKILPGRTASRDLLGEISSRLQQLKKHLILYYNHSCNEARDLDWERAIGYHESDKTRFENNLYHILIWPGEQYGSLISGWWLDGISSIDPRGSGKKPQGQELIRTNMEGYEFPFEQLTVALKSGYPQRLVTYNAGVNRHFMYTKHMDYFAGAMADLKHPASSRYDENGLQWHSWTKLDNSRAWCRIISNKGFSQPIYPRDEVLAFVKTCNLHESPVCFNVEISQEGIINPNSIAVLKYIRQNL